LGAFKSARERGRTLTLRHPRRTLVHVLRMTSLDTVFPVEP
jgi:anti-anti-sigma regulatory factor